MPRGPTTGRRPPPWRTASARATSDVGPAADRDRGLRRRRQVDADRAPAARLQGAAGRPRGPRARHRRPAGGARAGHHDRRRLPLLRDAAALVHPRRHARPRALHAQHGHGRLDRRPRAGADRRPQGPARAVAPARLPGGAARDPASRGVREQDGPRRLLRGALPGDRGRRSRPWARSSGSPTCARCRSRRSRATTSSSARSGWRGTPSRRCWGSSRRSRSSATATSTTSASRSSGRSATATTAAMRDGSRAACWRPATRSSCSPRARARGSRPSTRRAGRSSRVRPPMVATLRLEDELDVGRGDLVVAAANPPEVARELDATVCWMVEAPARVGARYLLKHTTRRVRANIASIDGRVDIGSFEASPTDALGAQRHRPDHAAHGRAGARRPVRVQPRDRRVHPDRRAHARHRRGRAWSRPRAPAAPPSPSTRPTSAGTRARSSAPCAGRDRPARRDACG